MAQTQIRGTSQILDGTIPASKFVTGLGLATTQLADGALFVKSNGSVAFGANQSMGGFTLSNLADAVAAQDAVNLRTAQALINGIAIKPSVKVTAVANVTLSGTQTIDGVALSAGDRVLLTAQSTASQNGPWLVASGSWTRPSDWAAASTQKEGILIIAAEGTTYHDTKWLCVTDGAVTVDTTSTSWVQDLSGTVYANGNGLSLTGSTFAVKLGNGVVFDGSNNVAVQANGSSLNVSASGVKIADGTAGQLMLAGSGGAASFTSVSGDVTITGAGVTTVNSASGSGFLKYGAYVTNETPSGSVNGSNTSYTLANAPASASLSLYYNGQLLEPGSGNDYTVSGTTITMLFAPVSGDKVRANYIK